MGKKLRIEWVLCMRSHNSIDAKPEYKVMLNAYPLPSSTSPNTFNNHTTKIVKYSYKGTSVEI